MKQFVGILTSILLLAGIPLFSGCERAASTSLTIYQVENEALYTTALKNYINQNTEIKLEIETFSSYQDLEKRLDVELMAGEGPDLLLFNTLQGQEDLLKLADSGVFLPLDTYIDALPAANYFQPILDAGQIKGQQYLFPLSWNFLQAYTTKSLMDNQGYRDQGIYQILPQEIKRLSDEGLTDQAVCSLQFNRADALNFMTEAAGLTLINPAGDLSLEKEAFQQAAGFTKLFYDQMKQIQAIVQRYRNDFVGAAAHLSFLLENYPFMNNLRYYQTVYADSLGDEMVMLPVGQLKDPLSLTAQVIHCGAVNAAMDHPEEAWKLLQYIADSPSSMDFSKYEASTIYYAPVNALRYQDCVNQLATKPGPGPKGQVSPLTEENAALLKQIPDQVTLAVIPNPTLGALLQEGMEPYLTGAAAFEDCLAQLQDRLALYLDE